MSANGGRSGPKRNDGSRRKIHSAERDLYLKPLLKLKQQQEILERGLIGAVENMKIEPDLLQGIVREQRELTLNRENFLNALYRNMEVINREMEAAKNIARNPEEIQRLDVNSYKQKLLKLWQKIQEFEKSCPLDTLLAEGATLCSELQAFEPDLQKYEKAQKNAMRLSQPYQSRIEHKKVNAEYKDVEDFHALVAATGHTENWPLEDHLFFLRTRKNCETVPALVAAIQTKCPDLSTETIVNHEAWYKRYQDLRKRQRAAVAKWREQKKSQKKEDVDEVECAEECNRTKNISSRINQEKKISARKIGTASKPVTRGTNSSADSNNSEKKELIRKWRVEKENKRSMDEEQIQLQMKLRKEAEENRRRKQREKMREALEEYKRNKFLENALKEQDGRSKEKCKYDTTLIKAFRRQDEEFTRKRKEVISRSRKPSKADLLELKKVELVEGRDYSTLMNPTEVWREKCKADHSMKSSNESRYIKDIPRTCVRWRNEESEDLRI